MSLNREEEKEIRALLHTIPLLASYKGPIERLGGLTNRVFRVGENVLRVAGQGTAEYINRSHEAEAARIAAAAGVSPAMLYVDATSGIMITRLVENAITMTPALFKSRQAAPARAALALKKLHGSSGEFPFRFELFAMIDDYLQLLSTKDVTLPAGYHDVVARSQLIRHALTARPLALAPCHCDPLCENFIDTGSAMWIVDWEYSGMNDPMWDLGDLSVEAGFSAAQDDELLLAYFGGPPTSFDHGRMVIYKAMCDLLWTLWGLIQLANKNPVDDFKAYAEGRFTRCKTLMATTDFANHLVAITS